MKYLFDVNKVDLVNLNGVDLREAFIQNSGVPFEKVIGNLVYENTFDLDLLDLAKKIHRGEVAEFNDREKDLFAEVIKGKYIPFIERQIMGQFEEIK